MIDRVESSRGSSPATSPSGTPTSIASAVDSTPACIETRAP